MMNQMQPQMKMGGTPELTEEELRKLAMLLQQMPEMQKDIDGQQHEMSYLTGVEQDAMETVRRDPGLTQSLAEQGKEMQPRYENGIRAFPPDNVGGTSSEFGKTTSSSSSSNSSSNSSSGSYGSGSGDAKYGGRGSHQRNQDRKRQQDRFSDQQEGGASSGLHQQPGETAAEYHNRMSNADYGSGQNQGSGSSGSSYTPPPPPKYKDINGTEFDTPEEAEASTAAIKVAMARIEKQTLTTDSTFARWSARNKNAPAYSGLSEEQMETAYNIALTKSQEDASAQVPKMVETMNNYFSGADIDENATYEEFAASVGAAMPANLSEATLRDMYENARVKFQRGEAFTLTPEEVAAFERDAIETATVDDAEGVTLDTVADATMTTVGEVADVTPTEVEAIKSVTDDDLDAIFAGGTDKAEALLLARVNGTADSPAERQLMRTTEKNLRMLLGATAGGDADPAKVRQLKNIWQDMTQVAIGEAADLRSQESLAAEAQLVELYRGKDTMKLNTKLANMEKDKQVAFKNGDLALAGKLANQQTALQRVITQASLDTNTKLANLEKAKTMAIEQGKMDLATSLANLQKNLTIATVDAKLAVTQRSMDDAVAMAAYKGQQALYGLEAQIDTETMKADLTMMGFELQRDLAELDSATQIRVAELTKQWREAQGDDQKQAAIIGAIGTVIGAFAKSDIRAKTNIAPGAGEVESFLDALNSYKYEYKDPAAADETGMFVGVMAQDLEKSPMGASFVKDTPRGKMVDYGHGLAAILASQANIHDRLRHLEEG